MTKRKPWAYLAIGGVLAVGLSSAAFAAELTDSNADSTNPAALHASDHASSVATAVLDALTGGSNPSTVAANANASSEHGNSTNANNVSQVTTETPDTEVSAGQENTPAGTTGTRPGWGCGDTNHVHTGPPGNPTASSPCNKH